MDTAPRLPRERLCVGDSGALVSQPSPLGKGDRVSGARVLSQTAYLRRSFPLSFIPLEPYPARSARHLPHAGKALIQKYRFPHPTSAPSGHLLPQEGGSVHASPFPWKGLPSAARRGWLPFLRRSRLLFAFPMQGKRFYPCAIIHNQHCPYEGKPKRRREHPAPLWSACIFQRKSAVFIV